MCECVWGKNIRNAMLAPTSLSALGKHSEIPLGLFFTATIVHIMVEKVFVSLCSS